MWEEGMLYAVDQNTSHCFLSSFLLNIESVKTHWFCCIKGQIPPHYISLLLLMKNAKTWLFSSRTVSWHSNEKIEGRPSEVWGKKFLTPISTRVGRQNRGGRQKPLLEVGVRNFFLQNSLGLPSISSFIYNETICEENNHILTFFISSKREM